MTTERDVLDELVAALGVSPSPDFEARVRKRVRQESIAAPRWTWTAGVAIAATVVLAVMLVPTRHESDVPVAPELTIGAPVPTQQPTVPALKTTPTARVRHQSVRAGSSTPVPAIVVPAGQDAAIQRLLAAGRIVMAPPRPGGLDELKIATVTPPDPLVFRTVEVRSLAPDEAPDLWRW